MTLESQEVSSEQIISIEPDAAILQVLTYLEMRPIDSLCELIDNSIDALLSIPTEQPPLIAIDLPTKREVEEGTAKVRVRDNGPGMTIDQLRNSLRAGYSSKPKQGSLGLFGVGFNIGTGKLGRTTRIITARKEDDFATETLLDLVAIRKVGTFEVRAWKIPKPEGLRNGTIIEVSQPWGRGNQNFEFMHKLIQLGRPKTLQILGRTYATILQQQKIRISVGEHNVEPFYHCVWSDARTVEHSGATIPAVYRFDRVPIYTYVKCMECSAIVPDGKKNCQESACGSSSIQTIEEKISGWVGIQRYSDASHYGIDLIRSGRAIRPLEKEAFFTFQDLEIGGDPIVDYPIDNRDGRIVGEVHLDHVPVDPAKQNFERSSPEWRRAVEFIRGKSSLQPRRPGANENRSPLFKLYQAYRKVRAPGSHSLTMGKWPPGATSATWLTRSEIDVFKSKFEAREPGYFDDAEWYRQVELADNKPVAGLIQCPSCLIENAEGVEECSNCGHIFQGKNCINKECNKLILLSSVHCQYCGHNQVPHIEEPWSCAVCGSANASADKLCNVCTHVRGALSPVSRENLKAQSHKSDALSTDNLSIKLASGDPSSQVNVTTYLSSTPIYAYRSDGSKSRLPSVRITSDGVEIYLDPEHPLFKDAGLSLEQQVASEVAAYLLQYHATQATRYPAEHSLTKLTYEILSKAWPDKLSPSGVEDELESLFIEMRTRLAKAMGAESGDVYENLPDEEKGALLAELVRQRRDVSEISKLKETGEFVHFVRPQGVLSIFRFEPKMFFDGNVWKTTYSTIPSTEPGIVSKIQSQIRVEHGCLLEIAAIYAEKGTGSPQEAELAKAACKLLLMRLGE